jgi:hypothetical protein
MHATAHVHARAARLEINHRGRMRGAASDGARCPGPARRPPVDRLDRSTQVRRRTGLRIAVDAVPRTHASLAGVWRAELDDDRDSRE